MTSQKRIWKRSVTKAWMCRCVSHQGMRLKVCCDIIALCTCQQVSSEKTDTTHCRRDCGGGGTGAPTLLVRAPMVTASVEDILAISSEDTHPMTWQLHPRYIRQKVHRCSPQISYLNVHSSFIHNNPKPETTQKSQQENGYTPVVYSQNGKVALKMSKSQQLRGQSHQYNIE